MTVPKRGLSESDIRLALRSKLEGGQSFTSEAVIIEELGICKGKARIDLAVIDHTFHGYEIKSDRDNLRRLPAQVQRYSQVVDKATIVITNHHLQSALHSVPRWWGVLTAMWHCGTVRIETVRTAKTNERIAPRSLVELLWADDAINLLEQIGAARGVRGKPRDVAWDRICELLELTDIAYAVRTQLRARVALADPGWRS